jgi:hypothetical protein
MPPEPNPTNLSLSTSGERLEAKGVSQAAIILQLSVPIFSRNARFAVIFLEIKPVIGYFSTE